MSKYTMDITFYDEDGAQTEIAVIEVPDGVKKETVTSVLKHCHDYLTSEEHFDEEVFATEGESPAVLLTYACNKHGWKWEPLKLDASLKF